MRACIPSNSIRDQSSRSGSANKRRAFRIGAIVLQPRPKHMINSPFLPAFAGFINGRWIKAESARRFPVINPATGDRLAEVPDMAEAETSAAIEAADRAWRTPVPVAERGRWL